MTAWTPREAVQQGNAIVNQLWTMHAAATRKVADTTFVLDVFGAGGRAGAEQVLADTARSITWLATDGLAPIDAASRGISTGSDPQVAWDNWKSAADAVGATLQQLQGFSEKWSGSRVLAQTTLDLGQSIATAAGSVAEGTASSLPIFLFAIAALVVLLLVVKVGAPVPA